MEKDPVCGMIVKTDEAAGRSEYQGKSYFFCSVTCKERFDHTPQTFTVRRLLEEETVSRSDRS
jgi:P-type Cu+ transporter